MNRNIKEYLLLTFKGMAMGAADVVPGVSGGTIALITGIYEELIFSIKSINLKAFKLLFAGKPAAFWKAINGNFLLSVVLGIGISIFSLAKGLTYLLHHYPILVWSFFFGLIIASTIYVARTIKTWNAGAVIAGIAGIAIAYFITVISPTEANTSWYYIFFSGMIAICAMILPGISGSFILVLLGMYQFILGAVGDLNIPVLLLFLAGAAIGIVAFSNFLSWLLKKFHNLTIALLAGFMVGSLNKIWPWKEVTESFIDRHGEVRPLAEKNILPGTYENITGNESWLLGAIFFLIVGFVLIFIIESATKRKR
jgi:putative membrane protein